MQWIFPKIGKVNLFGSNFFRLKSYFYSQNIFHINDVFLKQVVLPLVQWLALFHQ